MLNLHRIYYLSAATFNVQLYYVLQLSRMLMLHSCWPVLTSFKLFSQSYSNIMLARVYKNSLDLSVFCSELLRESNLNSLWNHRANLKIAASFCAHAQQSIMQKLRTASSFTKKTIIYIFFAITPASPKHPAMQYRLYLKQIKLSKNRAAVSP